MRKMTGMLCLIFAPIVLFWAKSVQLPTLPRGELPNSEVTTNVALNVDYARLENLTFALRDTRARNQEMLHYAHPSMGWQWFSHPSPSVYFFCSSQRICLARRSRGTK